MKAIRPHRGWRSPCEDVEIAELNITPIMNMFVILIPFLVSMAVFTRLAVVEFSLPPNVDAAHTTGGGKPRLKLTVVVAPTYLAVTHGEHLLDSIPARAGTPDWSALSEKILLRRAAVEIRDEAIVAARDAVAFKHVVKAMDHCREAGFTRVGLSSAPEPAATRGDAR